MHRIRVLIADDHALVRSGLRALIGAQPDFEVVGEAADGVVVVDECRRRSPDVVLMDLTMPGRGGVAAIEDLQETCPGVKTLVVTMHEDEAYARQALVAGASGYVLKKSLACELLSAIRAVYGGQQRVVSASLAEALKSSERDGTPCPATNAANALSQREREVLSLIALGHTTVAIARRLCISDKTVETHRLHISEKLGLRTRAELVRFAIEHDLLAA